MATTLTTTERRRPTTLRAAVRRLFALASNSTSETSSPAGMFDRAQNTTIQHANFTINQYGGIVTQAAPTTVERQPSEGTYTFGSSLRQGNYERSPNPQRENPDVYVDCLLSEKRGYPLWTPSPNMSLPVLHRTLGVSLGDVGVLNPEGGFEFLFNIFHDSSHPINTFFGVPERFTPFPQPKGSGTWEHVFWNAGSSISNPRMSKVNNDPDQPTDKITLRSKEPEAAVLMFPEDVHGTRTHVTLPLLKYIEENTAAWYTFVRVTLGRTDIHNGDLRVVYGCRKSSGFGMTTTFNTDQETHTELTFSKDSTWAETSGCAYRWSHTGSAEAKAGPRQQEISDLCSTVPPRNQCLFISTIDTKVSAKIWNGIEGLSIGAPVDENLHLTSGPSQPREGPSRESPGESDGRGTEYRSASHHRYHERVFHPSALLHNILETIAPGLPVYVVRGDDWEFMLEKDMDVSDFIKNVLTKRSIFEDSGMAYFDANTQFRDIVEGESVAKIEFSQAQRMRRWKATRTLLTTTTDPAPSEQSPFGQWFNPHHVPLAVGGSTMSTGVEDLPAFPNAGSQSYRTLLNNYVRSRRATWSHKVIISGPPHDAVYTCQVLVDGVPYGSSMQGRTKNDALEAAARSAFANLQAEYTN